MKSTKFKTLGVCIATLAFLLMAVGSSSSGSNSSSSNSTTTTESIQQDIPETSIQRNVQETTIDNASNDSTALPASDTVKLYFDIEFIPNLVFSTYDIEVYVDDLKIGTIPHGKHFTYLMDIEKGKHTVKFYGLTATPKRSDGHQPIIFMQCGKIRYTANAKEYALKHSFDHILVPRFTKYCPDTADDHITITQMIKLISESTYRNNMIADDVRDAIKQKRNPIVISERLSHLETLYDILKGAADHIFILSGQGTAKSKRELLDRIRNIPDSESVILLATGKYVGEGFDEPRLDMLFLVSPISWSGTLSQYVGRLHREYKNKTSVIVYDYADIKVPVFEKMYKKRLKGYAGLGYRLNSNSDDESGYRTIYTENFENDLIRDVLSAERSVYISASYIGSGKIKTIIRLAQESYLKGIVFKITIKKGDTAYYNKLISIFAENNIDFITKNKLTNSNVILDGKTVWYSSGELFYNSDDECVLRITDELLASELIENIR